MKPGPLSQWLSMPSWPLLGPWALGCSTLIVGNSPADYGTFVRREMTTLADLFKRGNGQPD